MGNPGAFKRSLIFSALSYLGFETYQVISRTAVVHATAKVLGVEEVLAQADYLYESGETEKLYQLLTQYKDSEDAELLWRLARVSRDVAQLSRTSEAERKLLVYEALEYAKRALEKNEASFAAHKWYAICISDVGDYEGIKAKIANAYVIKEHFEKAIELNPKDATSIHLMGIWSCIGLFRRVLEDKGHTRPTRHLPGTEGDRGTARAGCWGADSAETQSLLERRPGGRRALPPLPSACRHHPDHRRHHRASPSASPCSCADGNCRVPFCHFTSFFFNFSELVVFM
ncbi:regulator of microtubule dynamics protein 1 isoform X3 [Pteropus alecto]|nr:regulator of microtubule dynamics protein 1 isoform X3 [Pteropus alecto]XP_024896907.1 regulator of microtubule dynamics protein 1 isoform X3 [Pteropus alecto]